MDVAGPGPGRVAVDQTVDLGVLMRILQGLETLRSRQWACVRDRRPCRAKLSAIIRRF